MNKFFFGEYLPGTSPVHQMNPASKLLLCILFIIMTLISSQWILDCELFLLLLISVMACRVSFKTVYHGIKPLLLIILLTAVLQMLFDSTGGVLIKFGPLRITSGGLVSGAFVFCRFSFIIIISTLLTLSTPPTRLASGIRTILSPLKYVKLPVNTIALMISIALRFIPTLYQELEMIIKAERSRGRFFFKGSILGRVKKITSLIIPLLFNSFEQAQKLSYAMISRGYQTNVHRTQISQVPFTVIDGIAWLIYLSFGALEIISRR